MFLILYPERRWVADHVIATWYSDAVANEEVDDIEAETIFAKASALDDAGIITLSHFKSEH